MMSNRAQDIHKQSWFSSLIKHGKWYIISSLFSKGLAVILLPIYTRYLSPSDYGILSSLNAIALLLPIFISLYLDSAFGRYFHEFKHDPEKLKDLFSTVYWFTLIWGSVVVFLTLISGPFWMKSLISVDVWPYGYFAFIPAIFNQIGILGMVFLRQSLKAKQTTFQDVTFAVIGAFFTLLLLVSFNYGVMAKLVSGLIVSLIMVTYYSIFFYRKGLLRFSFDKQLLFTCLAYSVPLIPNIAGGWIAHLSDRLVIGKYINMEAVGLYSIGAQIAYILYMFQDAITQVMSPISMSGLIYDKESTKIKIAKYSLSLLGFMLLAHIAVVLFSQEFLIVFTTKSYVGAYKITAIIAFIYVMSSQYRIFADIISFHKKMWIISTAGIMMAVVNLALNLLLVPRFGYISSAFITNIAMFVYTLWLFYWSQKLEPIKIFWMENIQLLIIYLLVLIFSYYYLLGFVNIEVVAMKIVLFLSTGLLFYYLLKDSIMPTKKRLE